MRPLCKCHQEPMTKNGWDGKRQEWKCRLKKAEYDKRFDNSAKGYIRKMRQDVKRKGERCQ